MLLEELCQYYRTFVPIPVWFRYLISYGEFGNVTRWSLGILLALLYLILKLLDSFGHLRTFRRVLWIFVTRPSYGVPASKRQCSDVADICSICQAEFQKPILLICQVTLFLINLNTALPGLAKVTFMLIFRKKYVYCLAETSIQGTYYEFLICD